MAGKYFEPSGTAAKLGQHLLPVSLRPSLQPRILHAEKITKICLNSPRIAGDSPALRTQSYIISLITGLLISAFCEKLHFILAQAILNIFMVLSKTALHTLIPMHIQNILWAMRMEISQSLRADQPVAQNRPEWWFSQHFRLNKFEAPNSPTVTYNPAAIKTFVWLHHGS